MRVSPKFRVLIVCSSEFLIQACRQLELTYFITATAKKRSMSISTCLFVQKQNPNCHIDGLPEIDREIVAGKTGDPISPPGLDAPKLIIVLHNDAMIYMYVPRVFS